tara:strand:- start:3093 stop:5003 length:1911 start_codon:yes stop_codon:yes gene_type:complete
MDQNIARNANSPSTGRKRLIPLLWAGLVASLGALLLFPASAFAETAPWVAEKAAEKGGFVGGFEHFVSELGRFVFYPVGPSSFQLPLVILVLVLGGIFYTIYMGFINIRGFGHAVQITRGVYDSPDDPGEIPHFQALTSALSATVGLGNIAGVAVAVGMGGPGAVFWMLIIAFFGMTAKFVECSLAQVWRTVDDEGSVHGGPMYYLSIGLKERGYGLLGKILGGLFAVCIIGGAFGGGNMFQANQSYELAAKQVPFLAANSWLYGVILAALVGLVIIGGIKRIGAATSRIVPLMAGIYILACLIIIVMNLDKLPGVLSSIVTEAFSGSAMAGGVIGALILGMQRAVFSNEAGVGSAAIAHSAAKTDEPIREGMVAMLGPFIDTIVICLMTATVLLITRPPELTDYWRASTAVHEIQQVVNTAPEGEAKKNAEALLEKKHALVNGTPWMSMDDLVLLYDDSKLNADHAACGAGGADAKEACSRRDATLNYLKTKRNSIATQKTSDGTVQYKVLGKKRGSAITSSAFGSVIPWFPVILSLVVFLFAYSTMISWSYYGEKGWVYLFGPKTLILYRILFLGAVVLGSVASLGAVLDFSDYMIFLCAFPNIIGGVILSPVVRKGLSDYWGRYQSGEMKRYK